MKDREKHTNLKRSLRKYFVEYFYDTNGIEISFDKNIAIPFLKDTSVSQWVAIHIEGREIDTINECSVILFCCCRYGTDLDVLTNTALNALIEDDGEVKTIPLYDTDDNELGKLVIFMNPIDDEMKLDDQTNFSRIPLYVKWAG